MSLSFVRQYHQLPDFITSTSPLKNFKIRCRGNGENSKLTVRQHIRMHLRKSRNPNSNLDSFTAKINQFLPGFYFFVIKIRS